MNYEEMSDLEIAARVLTAKGISYKIERGICFINHGYEDGACVFTHFDPCNNWADAGPIIVENKMTISPQANFDESQWGASCGVDDNLNPEFAVWSENPLRAAMICFLEIKDAENE
mgnify:CR=1 FL=1